MSGAISSAKSGNSTPVTRLAGLQVGASLYGIPIPLIWGTNRLTGNLVWYGNFTATAQYSSGGKGGGNSSPSSYAYSAAGYIGLCEGGHYYPSYGYGQGGLCWPDTVWSAKDITSLSNLDLTFSSGFGNRDYSYTQDVWPWLKSNYPSQALVYSNLCAVYSPSFALSDSAQMPNISFEIQGRMVYGQIASSAVTISGISGNVITTSTPHNFGYNQEIQFNSTGTYPYISAPVAGSSQNDLMFVIPLSPTTFNLSWYPQQASSTTNQPILTFSSAGSGTVTAVAWQASSNPAEIIQEYLSNTQFGVNAGNQLIAGSLIPFTFPLASMSDPSGGTGFAEYCIANGIFLSPALTSQEAASSFIDKVCEICNSAAVWSQGKLKIVPYGDTSVTGNGVTYNPITTPQYDLTDDDFLDNGSTGPIVVTRGNPADAFNSITVNFADRTAQYNTNVAQAQDQANIDLYGLRQKPPYSYDYIVDATIARNVAQVRLQRELYMRNQYSFKLGWKYARLEQMDLVTITDSSLGYNKKVVRIIEVEEDSSESLSIIAEDYLANNATATAYPYQTNNGYQSMFNTDPGNALNPIIVPAPIQLAQAANVPELWMVTAGGVNWGGCDVYFSIDGNSYTFQGKMTVPARMGVVAGRPLSSVPQYIQNSMIDLNVLSVDLTSSLGILSSSTAAEADLNMSLCVVDTGSNQELLSYQAANLVSANKYALLFLSRNLYGSKATQAHAVGVPFARLDYETNGVFKKQVSPSLVGTTIFIKLVSFNQYGAYGDYQSLANSTAIPYIVPAAFPPPQLAAVTGLEITGQGNNTTWAGVDAKFSWRAATATGAVDIGSEPYGAASGARDIWFKDYQVQIFNSAGGILRTEFVADAAYTYTYAKNFSDNNGTPTGVLTIKVWERGIQNQLSITPAMLAVVHGVPNSPNVSLTPIVGGFGWLIPPQSDVAAYAGMNIWVTQNPTTTPSSGSPVYSGASQSGQLPAQYAGSPCFIQVQAFNVFGGSSSISATTQVATIPDAANQGYLGTFDATGTSTYIGKSAAGTGGSPFSCYSPTTQLAYVMDSSTGYYVYSLDPNTLATVGKFSTGGLLSGYCTPCWCPSNQLFYMVQQSSNQIFTFDPAENTFANIGLTLHATTSIAGLRTICFNPVNGYLYFATGDILNPLTNSFVTYLNPFVTDGNGTSVCYCPVNQSVFLNEVHGETYVLTSATTPTVGATIGATAAYSQRNNMTYCPANGMLYLVELSADHTAYLLLRPLNPNTLTFGTTLTIPAAVSSPMRIADIAYCPSTGKIAVLIIGYINGVDWNLYVVIFDPATGVAISVSSPVDDYGSGGIGGTVGVGNATQIEYMAINQKLLVTTAHAVGYGNCSYLFST